MLLIKCYDSRTDVARFAPHTAFVDPTTPARLLPGFLHDRSPELRRDAVAARLDAANASLKKGDKSAAVAARIGEAGRPPAKHFL